MPDLKKKLKKTREGLFSPLKKLFSKKPNITSEDEEVIEQMLLKADVGVDAAEQILESLKKKESGDYKSILREELLSLLSERKIDNPITSPSPGAIIIVGVNGVGKTTTAAKLAYFYKRQGRKVLLAACDTFRAAAVDQLQVWAQRLEVQVIAHRSGGDPAAVAYDACSAALARKIDKVIIDTAGRLHTKTNLMKELNKIRRVCSKVLPPSSVQSYLIIDATLGQNSLVQAREFKKELHCDGIILTKLDSTARGGIVIGIKKSLGIPVKFIGLGEKLDDFSAFSPEEFVAAIIE